jgi:hypothetical protein
VGPRKEILKLAVELNGAERANFAPKSLLTFHAETPQVALDTRQFLGPLETCTLHLDDVQPLFGGWILILRGDGRLEIKPVPGEHRERRCWSGNLRHFPAFDQVYRALLTFKV